MNNAQYIGIESFEPATRAERVRLGISRYVEGVKSKWPLGAALLSCCASIMCLTPSTLPLNMGGFITMGSFLGYLGLRMLNAVGEFFTASSGLANFTEPQTKKAVSYKTGIALAFTAQALGAGAGYYLHTKYEDMLSAKRPAAVFNEAQVQPATMPVVRTIAKPQRLTI